MIDDEQPFQVKNVASARDIFSQLWQDDELRRRIRAQVRGQLEGERPFNPSVLEERGELWRCNHNFRDAENAALRAEMPYWEMVNSTPTRLSVDIFSKSPHAAKWGKALATAFDMWLEDWGAGYQVEFGRLVREYIRFGAAYPRWDRDDDPHFRMQDGSDILFPKDTPVDPSRWEVVAVRGEMSAGELWKKYNSSEATELGWDKEGIKKALLNICPFAGDLSHDDWNALQDELVNNDMTASVTWPAAQVVELFVRDEDKGVSQFIFLEDMKPNHAGKDVKESFLFHRERLYDDFTDFLGTVFWELGNGKVHSVKGFAVRNFGLGVLTDKIKCKAVDGASLSMSLNLTRTNDAAEDAPPFESYGAVNVLPPGLQVQQVYPNLRDGLQILNLLENTGAQNNVQYRENQRQIQNSETATQAEILASMQAAASQANAALFLAQMGQNVFAKCFERLMRKGNDHKEAKKFRERAKEMDVPEEVLDGEFDIQVGCAASPKLTTSHAQSVLWERMLQLIGMNGVNGKLILENYFATTVGAKQVQNFLPEDGRGGNASALRQAMQENSDLSEGMPLPVDETDDHVIHATEHLRAFEQAVGRSKDEGQVDPNLAPFIQFGAQHLAEHFDFIDRDEVAKKQAAPLRERYIAARNAARGLITNPSTDGQ